MIPQTHVEVAEVLCHLAGRTNAPSSMGSQLDRLKNGEADAKRVEHTTKWCAACLRKPKKGASKCSCGRSFWAEGTEETEMHVRGDESADQDAEGLALKSAAAFLVISDIARIRTADLEVDALVAVTRAGKGRTMGKVVVQTLRAFQEALAAPSDEDIERATKRAAKATSARRDEVFQRALGEYRAPRGLDAVQQLFGLKESSRAAELYADCFLVLSTYVQAFNRKKKVA